jgi:hypothetical protein
MWEQTNGGIGDEVLEAIYEYTGFDALPIVLEEDEFDILAEGNEVLYRGLTGYSWPGGSLTPQELMDLMRFGRHYPGLGIYGNGTYSSTVSSVAFDYASQQSTLTATAQNMLRMMLNPAARIADSSQLAEEYGKYHSVFTPQPGGRLRSPAQELLLNSGRFAAAKGFDAIRVAGPDGIVVVLNRGALTVSAQPGLGPRVISFNALIELWNESGSRLSYLEYARSLGYKYLMGNRGDLNPTGL